MLTTSILFECEDYLVLNKAAGASMHSESGAGLIEQLREELANPTLYPVHRLDAVTTGCLLVAKSRTANTALSLLFQQRQIEKLYLALLDRKPKKTQGHIEGDMLKTRNGSWRLSSNKANPARTHFFSYGYAPNKRVALLKPFTGKTHQLRVAMKALGAPIVGDARYGGSPSNRTWLHAWQLRFTWQGKLVHYIAPFNTDEDNTQLQRKLSELGDAFSLAWPQVKHA